MFIAAFAVVIQVLGSASGLSAVISLGVPDFVAARDKWSGFATSRQALTLRGRAASVSKLSIRFEGCDLRFRFAKGFRLRKRPANAKNVEVDGVLVRNEGRLTFFVVQMRERPSDLETFRQRLGALRADQPAGWYVLGSWAAKRAEFYHDKELASRAQETYLIGIRAARKRLPPNQPRALLALAARIAEYKLPDSLRLEYVHEAYQMLYRARLHANPKQPHLKDLAEQLAGALPGGQIPLSAPQPKLAQAYWKNPTGIYQAADKKRRTVLHRLFYKRLLLTTVLQRARADGSNGRQIAETIDRDLPEEHALAEMWREKQLVYDLARVGQATKNEAVDLARRFRKRGQPARARSALEGWLAARTKQLDDKDPKDYVSVARDYSDLVHDERTAAALLIRADKLRPGDKQVAKELQRLGYGRRNGTWFSRQELTASTDARLQRAMRDGRVVAGMTAKQVRSTLGRPTSITRIATSGEVVEIWVYGVRRTSRLTIRFSRPAGAKESKAVQVAQAKP